jgi:hypothetical protein
VATEAEMDRVCDEWIGLVVWATRAGLRPAPTGGSASRRWRVRHAPASRGVTKRRQADLRLRSGQDALHTAGFVDLAHIAP